MHDVASELRRILLPRTPVNKGKREGPGLLIAPALFFVALFYQSTYSLKRTITVRSGYFWPLPLQLCAQCKSLGSSGYFWPLAFQRGAHQLYRS
jgi:hypothetical protein